jgi:hypothetical protein
MVGGIVIGIARTNRDTFLHIQGMYNGHDEYSVRIVEKRKSDGQSVVIKLGDEIWWQSHDAMWTPATSDPHHHTDRGKTWDIVLTRVASRSHDRSNRELIAEG